MTILVPTYSSDLIFPDKIPSEVIVNATEATKVANSYVTTYLDPNFEVAKGICYGQTDLDITETFEQEVAAIVPHIPHTIQSVFSSPLQRCKKLADALFPQYNIELHADLMELNCGSWEMQEWMPYPSPRYNRGWMIL